MRPRTILTLVLFAFVSASIGYLIAREVRRAQATSRPTGDPRYDDTGHKVVVYFLYFLPRCPTCNAIEAYAREAVEAGFRDDIEAGRLEWRTADYDRPVNAHFVDDFDLETKSVVLVEVRDGRFVRWKNLPRVWDLLDDKEAYLTYARENLAAFIEGVSW